VEEWAVDCVYERQSIDSMVTAPGLDQGGPFLQLRVARGGIGLWGEEWWK